MPYIPLHHKYRPQTFADLVGQSAIATTLTNALTANRIAPAYLFTGPRGTGKTSSARILAKSLNCLNSSAPTATPCGECDVCQSIALGAALDVIEIDAASNTGVDNIREIIERAQYAPVQCRYKVYTIDECHMLSTAAFNSLLKTLEEPPPHVVFILATTDPQRVLPTIISRCQRFDYRRIGVADMVEHLSYIAEAENISIAPAAILPIAQLSQGGLRDAESLLDRLSLLDGEITPERVWEISGTVGERDLLDLLKAIATNNPEQLLDRLRGLLARGKEPLTILQSLAGCYRDLAIAKTAPARQDLVIFTAEGWQELCEIATEWQLSAILGGQVALKESESQLKQTTQPYLWLEVSCLGLFPTAQIAPVITQVTAPISHPATPPVSQPPRAQVAQAPTPPVAQSPSPTNLAEIWQQTLDRLPKSSQSLLAQYGSPIDITAEQAIVGLKTNTFLKIAEGKIPELTKAFTEVLGRAIQVKLALASTAPTSTPSVIQSSTAPVTPSPITPVSHAPTTHSEPDEYLTASDDEIADDEEPEPVAVVDSPPITQPIPQPIPQIEPPPEPPKFDFQRSIAPAEPIQPAEEPVILTPTDIALQAATDRLIQLFNGEIAADMDEYSGTGG